jgi:ClpP class serine protease
MIDDIFPDSVALLEDLIYDADPGQDLHLLLDSPGGDGETAIRLVRSMQARCRELTVLIPDQAKSAATLLALGAHPIVMGPTSDLGPVDPQFRVPRGSGGYDLVAAKDMLEAVERAERPSPLSRRRSPCMQRC